MLQYVKRKNESCLEWLLIDVSWMVIDVCYCRIIVVTVNVYESLTPQLSKLSGIPDHPENQRTGAHGAYAPRRHAVRGSQSLTRPFTTFDRKSILLTYNTLNRAFEFALSLCTQSESQSRTTSVEEHRMSTWTNAATRCYITPSLCMLYVLALTISLMCGSISLGYLIN